MPPLHNASLLRVIMVCADAVKTARNVGKVCAACATGRPCIVPRAHLRVRAGASLTAPFFATTPLLLSRTLIGNRRWLHRTTRYSHRKRSCRRRTHVPRQPLIRAFPFHQTLKEVLLANIDTCGQLFGELFAREASLEEQA